MKSTSETAPAIEFAARKRAMRLLQVASTAPGKLKLFRRVYAEKASPRQVIKCFCLECVGLDEAAIRGCTAPACPLWNLRPYQRGGVT